MIVSLFLLFVFFFKQKTAYEMRISDWSSDVCSSDLLCRCVWMERRRLKNRTARVFETRAAPNPNRSRRTIMAESQNTTSPAEGAITLTTIAALQAAYERSEAAQLRIDRENCCKNVPHDKL